MIELRGVSHAFDGALVLRDVIRVWLSGVSAL